MPDENLPAGLVREQSSFDRAAQMPQGALQWAVRVRRWCHYRNKNFLILGSRPIFGLGVLRPNPRNFWCPLPILAVGRVRRVPAPNIPEIGSIRECRRAATTIIRGSRAIGERLPSIFFGKVRRNIWHGRLNGRKSVAERQKRWCQKFRGLGRRTPVRSQRRWCGLLARP